MNKRTWGGLLLAALLIASPGARANEWDPSVGLTFVSGFMDVVDWYEDALGADVSWAVPIGMSLGVSYEFDHGSRLGADLGPIALLMVKDSYDYGGGDTEFFRKGVVGLGVELGYDGSTIEMDDGSELKPGEVLLSVRAVF